MPEGFGENVAPTDAIRAILGSYPFSIGLLRELLQNSDDAKATKQTFVLDRRIHESASIYHPHLAETQGPALLAYNDELIQEEDWKALQNIHRSSKVADTSKIGKYGIGFRSCYHITDTPHILSGSQLAILDPQHDFAIGGVKFSVLEDTEIYRDHLSSFDAFLPSSGLTQPFNGSAFRLPLRKSSSQIGNRAISPDEISQLLKSFALEELNIALLYLHNVTSIEIYEIGIDGSRTEIGSVTVDKSPTEFYGQYKIQKSRIRTLLPDSSEEREWRILHAPFSEKEAVEMLSERLGGNPTTTLSQHKLIPSIDLAYPLNMPCSTKIGRLFTFLPLPLRTEFPIHINALFSLTQSRQNLRNGGEVGIVKNSDDHALIEWNQLLFDTFIPKAWASLLEVLVRNDQMTEIFDAWPVPQADVQSGDYFYWKDMPRNVTKYAISLPIWPFYGQSSPAYGMAESFLIAELLTADSALDVLARTGLAITQPPQYITQIILDYHLADNIRILSPQVAHSELLNLAHELKSLNDADIDIILAYLLSTLDCNFIISLPLAPSVNQNRVELDARDPSHSSLTRVLLNEAEETLFGSYDPDAISLQRLMPDTRRILLEYGLTVLNITTVDSNQVVTYLNASPYVNEHRGVPHSDQIDWLDQFWSCAQESSWNLELFNPFFLAPTTQGLRRRTETIFSTHVEPKIVELLEMLGVIVLDPRVKDETQGALKNLFPCSNIHALLRALPSKIYASFTEDQASQLSGYLIRHLSSSSFTHGPISTDPLLRSRLRSVPMYPLLSSPNNDSSSNPASVPSFHTVRGVDPTSIPMVPQVASTTWINLQSIKQDILQYLDPNHPSPLSASEMQDLMLKHFKSQSLETRLAFVQYLVSNSSSVSRGTFDRLACIEFIPARDGRHRAPKNLVDPEVSLAQLYPGASSTLPDTSQASYRVVVSCIRSLNLFITALSLDILRDRIRFIASSQASESERLATTLINYVSGQGYNCRRLFDSTLSWDLKWIPTSTGLENPLSCRDASSHQGLTHLFDEVMPMVNADVHIGYYLRKAFHWDVEVPFEVLSQQLIKVLESTEPSSQKVHDIVEHIGRRKFGMNELASLRVLLDGHKWVPTRKQTLVSVPFALLGGEDLPEVGFYSVSLDTRIRKFLRDMGCVDRPSKETILNHLQSLYDSRTNVPAERVVVLGVIHLFSWLPQLSSSERTRLIIPDIDGILRPFDSICYNDLGSRSCLVDTNANFLAHSNISEGLANELGMRRLGLVSTESQLEDDLDMGEDLLTTIRNRLREYTDSQLLLEFLANASDAGATEFNILHDHQDSPGKALISSHCRSFQRAPALVVHNNSVFTDEDFRGILRTGIGGKAGRRDTIGQFGLGALTMFHVTELAMIISRDQVLFLNPCKAHLSVGRVALRLPLSTVRRLYGDHLTPLLGLFDFNPPDDLNQAYTYNGTLFRLPVRADDQSLPGAELIFKRRIALPSVISSFEKIASKCLLFTSIITIQCFERRVRTLTLSWSAAALHGSPTRVLPNLTLQTTFIREPSSSQSQEWRVLSLTINEDDHPSFLSSLQDQYRLRLPVIVRMTSCSTPYSGGHSLFSTLPLPIKLDLPVHISAPFILASDRRSIRLDEYGNNEALYNRWVLVTMIPTLYLHTLADRCFAADNAIYWPGNKTPVETDEYNIISTTIMDALYRVAANTELPILRSKYHARALSPQDAHLTYLLPGGVSEVLDIMRPWDVVKLPPSITRRLRENQDAVTLVEPKYIHDQIKSNPTRFSAEMLVFIHIRDVVTFLLRDPNPFNSLNGLPLLPLDDGSFATFGPASGPCFYVVPPTIAEEELFLSSLLVHRDLEPENLLKVSGLNVCTITDASIGGLLEGRIPRLPTLSGADHVTREWIKKFWKNYPSLKLSLSGANISDYPLIPTLTTGLYHSLNHCKSPDVIIADFNKVENFLSTCLIQMGFTLINTGFLSKEVRSALIVASLTFEYVASRLFDHPRSLEDLFNLLESEMHRTFREWIISNLHHKKKKWFLTRTEYRRLPLWRSVDGSFLSVADALMLPQLITFDSIAPFTTSPVVGFNHLLNKMDVNRVSDIRPYLNKIPSHLKPGMEGAFEQLVNVLLANSQSGMGIPVPNSRRMIKESTELYSSREDLFLAAFGSDSERFILPLFRKFENRLDQFGLIQKRDLSLAMFRTCVEAFQGSNEDDPRTRAAVIYIVFSEELPLHANASNKKSELQWKMLDHLRFIPRNMFAQPIPGVDATPFIDPEVESLPDIVSPSKLIRAEFIPIAWSQRAIYSTEPHQRLIMAYPGLSTPTAEEVVNHLAVLATSVAQKHSRNPSLIRHLEQTYQWLNDHAKDAQFYLQLSAADGAALFLNVDDPTNTAEEWNWKRADHILLDIYDTGFLQCPRDFLKPFNSLLTAAGAVTIDYGKDVEPLYKRPKDEERLSSICTSFDRMRKQGVCTDVSFICDPPDDEPLSAHRAYLAAYTTHFNEMFSGSFTEAGDASSNNPIIVTVQGYSRNCVESILHFVYTMKEPRFERTDSDTDLALEMLTLANVWSLTELHRILQNLIIRLKMVDPFNLEHVLATAENTEATELIDHCKKYRQRNKALIAKAIAQAQA